MSREQYKSRADSLPAPLVKVMTDRSDDRGRVADLLFKLLFDQFELALDQGEDLLDSHQFARVRRRTDIKTASHLVRSPQFRSLVADRSGKQRVYPDLRDRTTQPANHNKRLSVGQLERVQRVWRVWSVRRVWTVWRVQTLPTPATL